MWEWSRSHFEEISRRAPPLSSPSLTLINTSLFSTHFFRPPLPACHPLCWQLWLHNVKVLIWAGRLSLWSCLISFTFRTLSEALWRRGCVPDSSSAARVSVGVCAHASKPSLSSKHTHILKGGRAGETKARRAKRKTKHTLRRCRERRQKRTVMKCSPWGLKKVIWLRW